MGKGNVKNLKEFFKKFDYFGVQFYFNYKSKEKFHSATGGIVFIIFLIIAIVYAIISMMPLVKREKMSIIYYTMQIPDTDQINFLREKSTFAIGITSCSMLKDNDEFWDVFQLSINHVNFAKENGVSKKTRTAITYGYCDENDFNGEFNSSFSDIGLDKYFCPKDRNMTIQGIYSDPIFNYIEVVLTSKTNTTENFERIKEILSDECNINLYMMNIAFDLSNFTTPVSKFIDTQFITLKYTDFMKMNSYYKLQKFDSYQNFLFDTHNTKYYIGGGVYETYSVFKGEDRLLTQTEDFNNFAKIYIRAGQQRNIIERRYMKLTDFAADVSSILSTLLLVLFVVLTFINKFFAYESVMRKIFKFSNPSHSKHDQAVKGSLNKIISKKDLFSDRGDDKTRHEKTLYNTQITEKTEGMSPLRLSESWKQKKIIESEVTEIKKKKKSKEKSLNFHFNFIEIVIVSIFPKFAWEELREKNTLLRKAHEKLFFQSDILNYMKHMQLLDLLNYSILEPNENTILQFLSKPSISLAQRKDIYDKIHKVNDIDSKEIDDLYTSIKTLSSKRDKTPMQKRLFKLTKIEMGAFMKKLEK